MKVIDGRRRCLPWFRQAELVVAEHPDGIVIPHPSLPFGSQQQQRKTPAVSSSGDVGDVDSPSSAATILVPPPVSTCGIDTSRVDSDDRGDSCGW
nr:hypothetical protein Itr_chr04CG17730 [Ipomoea trifida]GLL25242.1 hypothetical protein Itr_chr04CG17740 [Ipomoea trifida]